MEVGFMVEKLAVLSRPLGLATALFLLVDLALHWREAPVRTEWVNENAGTSALNGWGAFAAGLLIAYLIVELGFGRRARVLAAGLAIAAAGVTFLEFFTGSATVVNVPGVVTGSIEATLWPAYLGLALAVVLIAAAVGRAMAPPPRRFALPPALPGHRVRREAL
jgi:hypothetical protein